MMIPAHQPIDDASPIPLNLEMATTLIARAYQARLTERLSVIGLTAAQWRTLRALAERRDGLGQRELAAVIGVEEPGVVRLVDTLEAAGLVQRRVGSTDRRSRIVTVTEAARPVIEKARALNAALCKELTGSFAAEELEHCGRTLRRLLAKLQSLKRAA